MYIQGKSLVEFVRLLVPGTTIDVLNADRTLAEKADHRRALELCDRDHVGGVATSARLKYLLLKVPHRDTARASIVERPGYGCIGQDQRTVHAGDDKLALNYSHDFKACSTYGPLARMLTKFPTLVAGVDRDVVQAACAAVGEGIC